MTSPCSLEVSDVEFQLSVFDLLVVLGEVQRRVGYEVSGFVDRCNESLLRVKRPVPSHWPDCYDVLLRFHARPHAAYFEFCFLLLDILNWEEKSGRWATSVRTTSYDSFGSLTYLVKEARLRHEVEDDEDDVHAWMAHSVRLCLHRGHRGYMWDAHSWDTLVAVMEERREAVWTEAHVWPEALAFYHLLTRRGVDAHCARHYVEALYLVPGRAAFAATPKKHRNKRPRFGGGSWLVRVRP